MQAGASCRLLHQHAGSRPVALAFGVFLRPHPDKKLKGGEDSYFASPSLHTFGVADGVGGYTKDGVDTGLFSRALMRQAHLALKQPARRESSLRDTMLQLLAGLRQKETGVQGGCTALLARLCPDMAKLSVLNLGDSGLMVFRPDSYRWAGRQKATPWPRTVLSTQPQNSFFNCPFQVSHHEVGSSELHYDVCNACDEFSVQLRRSDIIVAASDGLFDNLFEVEIQGIVARWLQDRSDPVQAANAIAEALGDAAHKRGEDTGVLTPFSRKAALEGYVGCEGGKMDDVTVVVGIVVEGGSMKQDSQLMENWSSK